MKVPSWARNHELRHYLTMLTCQMQIAYRQILFWRRLSLSPNALIAAVLNSPAGQVGLAAQQHWRLRQQYEPNDLVAVAGTF